MIIVSSSTEYIIPDFIEFWLLFKGVYKSL